MRVSLEKKRILIYVKSFSILSNLSLLCITNSHATTISGNISGAGDVTFTNNSQSLTTITGAIENTASDQNAVAPSTGAGNIIFNGGGSFELNNSTTVGNSGGNSYPGSTVIQSGALNLVSGQLPSGSGIYLGNSNSSDIGGLGFVSDFTLDSNNPITLTSTANNGNVFNVSSNHTGTISHSISGSTSTPVLVTGGGTLALSASNTIGATSIDSNTTLQGNHVNALNGCALTLNGGTFNMNATTPNALTSFTVTANSHLHAATGNGSTAKTCTAGSFALNSYTLTMGTNTNITSNASITGGTIITPSADTTITFTNGNTMSSNVTLGGNLSVVIQ